MTTRLQRIAIIGTGLVVAASLTGCGGGTVAIPAGTSTTTVGVPSPTGDRTSTPMPGVTTSSVLPASAVRRPVLIPVSTGPSERYRHKTTDSLRTSAPATITPS